MPLKTAFNSLLTSSILCFSLSSNAQVIDYRTKIKIKSDEKVTERRLLIQVNSKEDNWLSEITIGHSPLQDFTLLEAKIIDAKGNEVRKFKKKDISTRNDQSYGTFYQDDLIESFNLFWNEYPYRIDYSYKIVEKEFISIAKWYPLFSTNVTTLHSSLALEIPSGYEVFITSDDRITSTEIPSQEKTTYRWIYGRFDHFSTEIYAPPVQELIPYVSIVPKKFQYGVVGGSDSWSSFGSWLSELNDGTNYLTASEIYSIDKLLENVESEEQIIRTLYQYLQEKTKYVNVSIDVGGLKSYPASYVCENKYGDCKALTTYMKAMLNYAGIESNYTIVNAGAQINRINKNFPSQQFNHVILSVPMENDTIWLENTSNSLPYNYLGTFTQDRHVLMINDEESTLGRTPKLELNDVAENRVFQFSIDEKGAWDVALFKTLGGKAFEGYQHFKTQENSKEQERKILREVMIAGFELTEWEILNHESDRTKINVSVSGKCKTQFREIGNLKVLNPLKIQIPPFENPAKREFNVRISYPINKLDSVIYNLPFLEDYEVQLPEGIDLKSEFGSYKVTYEVKEATLSVTEHFQLNSGDYSLDEYPNFYSFINSIEKYQKNSAIILK